MIKLITIVGARPQFIKAAALSHTLKKYKEFNEIIVHTGQHYDHNMSQIFFEELGIPFPSYNLNVSGFGHGAMTGRMTEGIEEILISEKPNYLLVYGDTNSTLAGALAASKLNIPILHVEAGLRSFNFNMPEEMNRILTDRLSSILFCPTQRAVQNLFDEGYPYNVKDNEKQQIKNVGDIMLDATLLFGELAKEKYPYNEDRYILCTLHRQENLNSIAKIEHIMTGLGRIAQNNKILFPIHPNTYKTLKNHNLLPTNENIHLLEPLPYLEMLSLIINSDVVITDSGGVQKEAYFNKKPCLTLRHETEWLETTESGWNTIVPPGFSDIVSALENLSIPQSHTNEHFGDGNASQKILDSLF